MCVLALCLYAASARGAGVEGLSFLGDCSRPVNTAQPAAANEDKDKDGISDACEQSLAEKYAPVVYHSSDESNFPTNVDWFLRRTELWFHHNSNPALERKLTDKPTTQAQLLGQTVSDGAKPPSIFSSSGTRSDQKLITFFLRDVDDEAKKGSNDSSDWTTYYHAYINEGDGITIQYWRFYSYNDALDDHGGDWEGIHLVLDKNLQPIRIGLLGHQHLVYEPFSNFKQKDGDGHPYIFSEGGGHASRSSGNGIEAKGCGGLFGDLFCFIDLNKQATFVRQETWTNGEVRWFDGRQGHTGPLLNVGEKLTPMNGQVFLQYSGIWGSPSTFPIAPSLKYYAFSGYWGPAFNETDMLPNGFIKAWCDGMKKIPAGECSAADRSP